MVWVRNAIAMSIMASICSAALAQEVQPPPVPTDRTQDLIEKQGLQERIDRELKEQLVERHGADDAKGVEAEVQGPRFLVTTIVVHNDSRTSGGYKPILGKYIGTQMGRAEIFALLRDLTNYYAAKGYSTTTVTLSGQNVRDGSLDLTVNWGYVDGWLMDGRSALSSRERRLVASAMPGWRGEVLNIHDIDQAIENLGNGAKTAKISVVPSERLAHSLLNVSFVPRNGVSASVDVDNSGSNNVDGHYKINGQLAVSDVLGLNETFSLGGGFRWFDRPEASAERNTSLSFEMPLGPWSANLTYSRFSYRNDIESLYGTYVSKGNASDAKARIARVLSRNQTGKTTAWYEVGTKDSANYIGELLLRVNSRRYTSQTLGISRSGKLWGGAAYADLAWTQGVDWFDAYAERVRPGVADPRYRRWASNLSWLRGFGAAQRLQYTARAGLQYSDDTLLYANQLNLGDEFTVRGFKGNGISGERGWYVSNTLSYAMPVSAGPWLNTVTPLIGLDGGAVRGDAQGAESETIAGAAVGLRLAGRFLDASAVVGFPLYPASARASEPEIYLRASLRY